MVFKQLKNIATIIKSALVLDTLKINLKKEVMIKPNNGV